MKNTFLIALRAFLSVACTKPGYKSFLAPDIPKIAYIGSFDDADKTKPVFMYSGCAIRTVFKVTFLEIVGTRA